MSWATFVSTISTWVGCHDKNGMKVWLNSNKRQTMATIISLCAIGKRKKTRNYNGDILPTSMSK